MKNIIISFLMILISCPFIFSQSIEDISTDRPDRTESPDVIPLKFIQFESGLSFEKSKDDSGENTYFYSLPELLIRYGVFKNIELRLSTEYIIENATTSGINENHFGFEQMGFGAKFKLFDEDLFFPKTSFIIETSIPGTASERYNNKYFAPGLAFLFSNSLSEFAELSYNLGIKWDTGENTKLGYYTISYALSPFSKTSFYFESFGYFASGFSPDLRLDLGATYAPLRNIQFDISSGVGLTSISPDFFLGIGFSIRKPK